MGSVILPWHVYFCCNKVLYWNLVTLHLRNQGEYLEFIWATCRSSFKKCCRISTFSVICVLANCRLLVLMYTWKAPCKQNCMFLSVCFACYSQFCIFWDIWKEDLRCFPINIYLFVNGLFLWVIIQPTDQEDQNYVPAA